MTDGVPTPKRPRLLDLFCKAGGAAMGYHRAGFEIVGIDIEPQPHYPFEFWQMDALDALEGYSTMRRHGTLPKRFTFDAFHASPPCQSWTAYRRRPSHVGEYPKLIGRVRELLDTIGLPYVIENVPGSEVRPTVQLCGSMFGLDVRRHRWFESNMPMLAPPCDHSWQTPRFPPATNRKNLRSTVEVGVWRIPLDVQQRAMSIDWMTLPELSEAIPPAYTEWVGARLLEQMEVAA